MSNLTVEVPHQLNKDEALARIKNLLVNLKEEQKDIVSGVKEEWSGDQGNFSFSAKGFELSGDIKVSDTNVIINAQLPFAVALFKGAIQNIIEQRAKALLA